MYCSFFFFKQKSAYELRISDWSSDVCSSDLLVHRRAHHLVAKLRGGKEGQALLSRRVAVRRLQPGAARSQGAVEIELHPDHAEAIVVEIGGASGRERVCQDV